jgi:hypothetical protein
LEFSLIFEPFLLGFQEEGYGLPELVIPEQFLPPMKIFAGRKRPGETLDIQPDAVQFLPELPLLHGIILFHTGLVASPENYSHDLRQSGRLENP